MGHYHHCRYCKHEVNAPCENMFQARQCDDFRVAPREDLKPRERKSAVPKTLPFPVITK